MNRLMAGGVVPGSFDFTFLLHGGAVMDHESLVAELEQGRKVRFLFFWGHRPRRTDRIDSSCLSQWFPSAFEVDGVIYRTAEHFMMAQKAHLFGDEQTARQIIDSPHPGSAKKLGRQVARFDQKTWNSQRVDIVIAGNYAKFSQNEPLRTFLCGTQNRVLVEASPVDKIWGIGLAADHVDASRPQRWPGLNLLGFALLEVRKKILQSQSTEGFET